MVVVVMFVVHKKKPEPKMQDCTEELKVLISAIDEIGSKGEGEVGAVDMWITCSVDREV